MEKGISLGLMIRGGIEYGLGVYVTGIDSNSLADKAGLKVCITVEQLLSATVMILLPTYVVIIKCHVLTIIGYFPRVIFISQI